MGPTIPVGPISSPGPLEAQTLEVEASAGQPATSRPRHDWRLTSGVITHAQSTVADYVPNTTRFFPMVNMGSVTRKSHEQLKAVNSTVSRPSARRTPVVCLTLSEEELCSDPQYAMVG